MGETTEIGWCDSTFNPWIGCTKVSAGCDRCYAEALMDTRWGKVEWGPHGERKRTSADNWKQPIRWNRRAAKAQQDFEEGMLTLRPHRPRVFCASLADVFDNQVPPEWRADLWNLIEATPHLDWLLLTKRPENILKMLPKPPVAGWPLPNVWFGTTCEDQAAFARRWPILREVPAWVRFISYEPAIGPLRLMNSPDGFEGVTGLDWLICGGESGSGFRDMPLRWEADIRRDCELARIPYFFKQLAGKKAVAASMTVVRQFPGKGAS